ncbi:hypothetical protein [Sedimenticola sp.]|uniref:nSTAND3 domain-containing NTPase n=1 Tax=Sedimenticola sp. TaxID=1940285 RepID=UPI003D0AD863
MAKINQIQNALKELDGGAFQKLADSYLLNKGYPQINPIGSIAGSNKVRKGTPDTLIPANDGKYIFGEYTTISSDKVYSKFSDDIAKCLDEDKTGIATAKIKEIVLCYTSDLSAEEIDNLREQCEEFKLNLNLFGLGAISYDLLEKYPGIAKDYLGIEVDTGQIVTLDKFVTQYERNKLTTTLQTEFHFREDEKNELLSLVQGSNLVIISGQAGVGKSRIAIEFYRQFISENKSYKAFCIFNQGIDLFEDIKSYFSDSGDFLIFVDDANRVSGFQYIVHLLQTKRSDQTFKILATVRDYALDKIKEICQPIGGVAEITIDPLTDEEIKKLLQDEFKINNHLFLDRIVGIAQGNPRISVMAAQVAKESNTLESISDVTELYDKYYSSIKADLDTLEDRDILKVVGIVAFFRSVDRTNDILRSNIENVFGISADNFWEESKKLHDMEVLDMFENEVVKVSDQVLSTYLFYLVFFKEKLIDFSTLINELFPKYKQRLIDAINPILNTFNFDEIKKVMEPDVDKAWSKMQGGDENNFLQLIDVFWFLKPTDTLIYIQDKISSINNSGIDLENIKFESDPNTSLPEFLSTLSLFRYLDGNQSRLSLDLFFQYAEKQPNDTPKILHCLTDRYGFQPDSYSYDYYIQHGVIDKLLEYSDSGRNEYFTRLFIALVENYLRTHFSCAKSGRAHTITFTQFDLIESKSLRNLREKILRQLFDLFKNKGYQKHILKLLIAHTQSGRNVSVAGIVEDDSKLILPFFISALDPSDIYHCIVVQKYLKLLKRLDIKTKKTLKEKFRSQEYMLYDLLTNKLERIELKLSHDAYREYKNKKIDTLTASYSEDDYNKILHQLYKIQKTLEGYSQWQINQGILSILENFLARDAIQSCNVIKHYLWQGDYLEISPWIVMYNMLRRCEATKVFDVINTPEYSTKDRWLFSYYQNLPSHEVQKEHLDALCELYENSDNKYFINEIDYLLKYEAIKKGFIAEIIAIIIRRASSASEYALSISQLLNPHTEIYKNIHSVFSGNFSLLEDAYIAIDKVDHHADYNGSFLTMLLDNDQTFIDRYLEEKFSRKDYLSHHDDSRDYSFIWMREDFASVMERITSVVFEQERKRKCFGYYESFFNKSVNPQTDNSILNKQNKYIINEIETKFNNNKYMCFLFSVVSGFSLERKLVFYKSFLDKNKSFDDFKEIPYEPIISSWSESAVPMLQEKIDFLEEIVQLCNSVELLKHRQFLEQRIQEIRNRIQKEKKRDFIKED